MEDSCQALIYELSLFSLILYAVTLLLDHSFKEFFFNLVNAQLSRDFLNYL